VDDCADALVYLLRHYSDASTINVGVGRDVTIAELASLVAGVVGFKGQIGFDTSRPDGTPRKLLDVSRLTALGWQAHTGLREGIAKRRSERRGQQGPLPWSSRPRRGPDYFTTRRSSSTRSVRSQENPPSGSGARPKWP
jgi:GDP-L-fucose synthase